MRKARAFDYKDGFSNRKKPDTLEDKGVFKGIIDAGSLPAALRHTLDFRCLHSRCDCTMHFRRAVSARPSRDPSPPAWKTTDRPATFVTDPGSSHSLTCPYDYQRLERDIPAFSHENGDLYIKCCFALGRYIENAAPAARLTRPTGDGMKSLQDVYSFMNTNFGSLTDPGVADICLVTTARNIIRLKDYLIPPGNQEHYKAKRGQWPEFAFHTVKPEREFAAPSSDGGTQIACMPCRNTKDRGPQWIRPVIHLRGRDQENMHTKLTQIMEYDRPVLIAGYYNTASGATKPESYRAQGYPEGGQVMDVHIWPHNARAIAMMDEQDNSQIPGGGNSDLIIQAQPG